MANTTEQEKARRVGRPGDPRLAPKGGVRGAGPSPVDGVPFPLYDTSLDDDWTWDRGLREYVGIIRKRKLWFLTIWFVCAFAALVYAVSQPSIYKSSAQIEIDPIKQASSDLVSGVEFLSAKGYLATQLEMLRSRGFAHLVVRRNSLTEAPAFKNTEDENLSTLQSWIKNLRAWFADDADVLTRRPGKPVTEGELVRLITRGLSVEQVGDTNIAQVSLEASWPRIAQGLLDIYLETYLERNLEHRKEEISSGRSWLKSELERMEKRLMQSENKLLEFVNKHGILFKDGELAQAADPLKRAMDRVRQAREEQIKIEAMQQGRPNNADGPQMSTEVEDARVSKLREQVALLEAEYSQLKGVYSTDYPRMKILKKRIDYLKRQLVLTEKERVKGALHTAKQEERLLKQFLDEAKREAGRINSLEAKYALLKKQVDTDRQFYNMLLKESKEMDIKAGTVANNVRIVDPAILPSSPVRPKRGLIVLFGIVLGFGLGAVAAVFRDQLDATIQTPKEIEKRFPVSAVGIVPDFERLRGSSNSNSQSSGIEFLAYDHPKSPASDAIKNINTSILLSSEARSLNTLLVSSASPGEGKTLIAVSMASILNSGTNKNVLLIDGDLRRPRVHKVFGHERAPQGLANLLNGNGVKLEKVIRKHRIRGLYYMPSGPVPEDPVALLRSPRMSKLMVTLKRAFDYVVIDSPPILGLSDTRVLCRYSDGVILVARQGYVRRDELQEAWEIISTTEGGHVLEVVLNKADPRGGKYYGKYRYGNYYGSKRYNYYSQDS